MAQLTDAELKALGIHKWTPEEIEAERNLLASLRKKVAMFAIGQVSSREQREALLRAWSQEGVTVSIPMPEDVESYLTNEPAATRCSLEITYIEAIRNMTL